jgi:hypothetical protein
MRPAWFPMPISRRTVIFVTLAVTAVLVASYGLVVVANRPLGPQGGPHPTGSPSPSVQPTPQPVILKPVLAGLVDRNNPPLSLTLSSYLPVISGFVVNVHWSDIQTAPGAPIASNNAIDQAIATLHRIDPNGRMGLKVRLYAGIYAPNWAKSLDGPPIPISDPVTGASGTVGRFWNDDFGAAYNDLENKLAAMYDSAPEIREITISRCMTVYAEPFIRDEANPVAVRALLDAGFTVDADQRCHREEITAHLVWTTTRSDLSFNPYQNIGGGPRTDEAFTEDMMSFCRSTLGARCVLANNSLRTPLQFQYQAMYDNIKSLGPPIAFQTASLAKVGDLGKTIEEAISLGAASVELPAGFQSVPVATLSGYENGLVANASRSSLPP